MCACVCRYADHRRSLQFIRFSRCGYRIYGWRLPNLDHIQIVPAACAADFTERKSKSTNVQADDVGCGQVAWILRIESEFAGGESWRRWIPASITRIHTKAKSKSFIEIGSGGGRGSSSRSSSGGSNTGQKSRWLRRRGGRRWWTRS